MELSKAIGGFIIYKTAEGKSPYTLRDYRRHLDTFCAFLSDAQIHEITATDLRRYAEAGYTYRPGDAEKQALLQKRRALLEEQEAIGLEQVGRRQKESRLNLDLNETRLQAH